MRDERKRKGLMLVVVVKVMGDGKRMKCIRCIYALPC